MESIDLGSIVPAKYAHLPQIPFDYVIDFNSTITTGGDAEKSTQLNQGGSFLLLAIKGEAWIPSANTAIARSPFSRRAGPTVASQTWAHLNMLSLEFRQTSGPWQSAPIVASLLLGDALDPNVLFVPRWIPARDTVFCKLTNNSAESIQAQLVLSGVRLG